ncbi:MAG: organomercurial lyase [Acidimicrobiales bacterium]
MTPTIEQTSAAFIDASAFLRRPEEQRLARTIYRLLATGHPAPPTEIAARADRRVGDVEQLLDTWPAVFRDPDGAVVGFWGLASDKVSNHRFEVDGAGTAWAWCAYDTLFITRVLGATAEVSSLCPATGTTVRLTVTPDGVTDVEPSMAMVSLLRPGKPFDDDVIQNLCHFIHFFASPDAAEAWTAEHPGTFSLAVDDAFEVARQMTDAVFGAVTGAAR